MKRLLNISTVEAWLLDRSEGTLSPEEERQLEVFLSQHPEIDADIDDLPTLERDEVSFNHENLLRSIVASEGINEDNYEHQLIAQLEGQLEEKEVVELEAFIAKNPHLEKEKDYYALTVQKPDQNIALPNRDSLLQKPIIRPLAYWSAAASIAVLITAFFLTQSPEENIIQMASKEAPALEVINPVKKLAAANYPTTKTLPSSPVSSPATVADHSERTPEEVINLDSYQVASLEVSSTKKREFIESDTYDQYTPINQPIEEGSFLAKLGIDNPVKKEEIRNVFRSLIDNSVSQVNSEFDRRLNIERDENAEIRSWSVNMGPLGLERTRQTTKK